MQKTSEQLAAIQPVVLTVAQLCKCYQLSKSGFYAMVAAGKGPKTLKRGRRRFIKIEEAARWHDAMEQGE